MPGKAERLNTTKCHNDSFAGFPLGKGQARQRSCNDINSTQFPNTTLMLSSLTGEGITAGHILHTHTRFKSLQDHSRLTSADEPGSGRGRSQPGAKITSHHTWL